MPEIEFLEMRVASKESNYGQPSQRPSLDSQRAQEHSTPLITGARGKTFASPFFLERADLSKVIIAIIIRLDMSHDAPALASELPTVPRAVIIPCSLFLVSGNLFSSLRETHSRAPKSVAKKKRQVKSKKLEGRGMDHRRLDVEHKSGLTTGLGRTWLP